MRIAVSEKRQACEVWLQTKGEASHERHKEKRRRGKRAVRDAKVSADERWRRKLMENFQEKKKMFWKKKKRIRKGSSGSEEKVESHS